MTRIPYPSDYDGPMGTAKCSICGIKFDVDNDGHQDEYTHALYCDDCHIEMQLEELNGELQETLYTIIDVLKDVWTTDKWTVDESGYSQHSINIYDERRKRFRFNLKREIVIINGNELPMELLDMLMLSYEMISDLLIDYNYILKKIEELS